jgi:small subunit ribosomal protein S2
MNGKGSPGSATTARRSDAAERPQSDARQTAGSAHDAADPLTIVATTDIARISTGVAARTSPLRIVGSADGRGWGRSGSRRTSCYTPPRPGTHRATNETPAGTMPTEPTRDAPRSGWCRTDDRPPVPDDDMATAEERTDRRSLTVPSVSMRQLLEAGVHFGHQTRRWNPKMRPFIFAERNGIHIIDLAQTVQRLDVALAAVTETVARGEQVLFVGTKKQAQEPIVAEATRANMPYVQKRWLGGMLTNFTTIKKRIGLLEQLEARQQAGDFDRMTKKEAAKLTEEMIKLQGTVGGMRKMKRLPGLVFIVDPHRERIAVTEANKLEIPVVGTGDTNVDPDELDFIIPANDDAIRSIRLLCTLVAEAAIEGARERSTRAVEPETVEIPMPETGEEEEVPGASEELVAALAGGAALTFEPDADEDDLLPGDRVARAEAAVAAGAADAEASPEEIAAEMAREAAEKAEDETAAG